MTESRSAGAPPAVARAPRPRFGSVSIRDRGYLPHWESDSGVYFITFRLADSLPASVLNRFRFERENIVSTEARMKRELSQSEQKRLAHLFSVTIERYLDSGAGSCILRMPEVASVVVECLGKKNDCDYRLHAWCVMPNHIHVIAKIFPTSTLAKVVQPWKSVTAHRINKLLSRTGPLWGREYFDHLIRNDVELERSVRYVISNPVKAGLRDWPWAWECGRGARTTAGEAPALP